MPDNAGNSRPGGRSVRSDPCGGGRVLGNRAARSAPSCDGSSPVMNVKPESLIHQAEILEKFKEVTDERFEYYNGSGADRIVGAIRSGVRPGDAAYAAMT